MDCQATLGLPKVEGGGSGGCPLVVFGITQRLYVFNAAGPDAVESAPPEPDEEAEG